MIWTSSEKRTLGAQPSSSLALLASPSIPQQEVDLCRAVESLVHLDDYLATPGVSAYLRNALALPLDLVVDAGGSSLDQLPHRVVLSGRRDVVAGTVLLQHPPHHLDVFRRIAPVPHGLEVADSEGLRPAQLEPGQAARHLAADEVLTAAGRLVVEQDPVAGVHVVGLSVVPHDPVGIELGRGVGGAGPEGSRLSLRGLRHVPEELRGGGLVEARVQAVAPDRLEQAQRARGADIARVLGLLERDAHVALRSQVVDLVGAHQRDDPVQAAGVTEIAVVQLEDLSVPLRALACGLDPLAVEHRGAAGNPVYLVALVEQQLCEIRAVLARHARDQGDLLRHPVLPRECALRIVPHCRAPVTRRLQSGVPPDETVRG